MLCNERTEDSSPSLGLTEGTFQTMKNGLYFNQLCTQFWSLPFYLKGQFGVLNQHNHQGVPLIALNSGNNSPVCVALPGKLIDSALPIYIFNLGWSLFYSLMMSGSRNVLSLPSEKGKYCPLFMCVQGSKKPHYLSTVLTGVTECC